MPPRIQIQGLSPLVDCGRDSAKACLGDEIRVWHDQPQSAELMLPPLAVVWLVPK